MTHRYLAVEYAADVEIARYWAGEVFRRGCARLDEFVAEMGGWDALPRTFSPSGPAWEEAEDAISEAAHAGRWWDTVALGEEYLARIGKFCDGWRQQMAQKRTAKAGR